MSATIHLLALNEASYNPPRKVEQRAMLPPKRCVLSLNQTCSDPPWFAKVITQAKQTMINWMSHLPDNVYTNLYPFSTVYVIFEGWLSAHFDLRNAFDESKSIPKAKMGGQPRFKDYTNCRKRVSICVHIVWRMRHSIDHCLFGLRNKFGKPRRFAISWIQLQDTPLTR